MKRVLLIASAGLLAAAAYRYQQDAATSSDPAALDPNADSGGDSGASLSDAIDSAGQFFSNLIPVGFVMYSPDKVPAQYRALIATTEASNGIPSGMLARLLYQESRYDPDIISGRKTSPAGALGIAQFMPATAAGLGIDPLDPAQAIPASGKYLASMYKSTKSWTLALAAYNWGLGNVQRKGIAKAPLETRNYYQQILADLGMNTVTA